MIHISENQCLTGIIRFWFWKSEKCYYFV